jgi:hypothetical protein
MNPLKLVKDTARQGWSGGLSESELALPGGILLSMLVHHANEKGHLLSRMATELNVTYGYISQLRNGQRLTAHISDQFATACALYLGCPRMTVLLAAGRVKAEDVFEDPSEVSAAIPAALRFIQSNPRFGPLMPPAVFAASPEMQLFVVTLFEAAEGRALLPGRQNMAEVAASMLQYEEKRAKLVLQVEADRKIRQNDQD